MPEPIDDKIIRGRQINEAQELINLLDNENVTGFMVAVTIERKEAEGKYTTSHKLIPFAWPAKSVLDSIKAYRKIYMDDLTGGK